MEWMESGTEAGNICKLLQKCVHLGNILYQNSLTKIQFYLTQSIQNDLVCHPIFLNYALKLTVIFTISHKHDGI